MDKEEIKKFFDKHGDKPLFLDKETHLTARNLYQIFKARMMLELEIVKRCEHEWEAVTDQGGYLSRSQCIKCGTYGDQYNLSTE